MLTNLCSSGLKLKIAPVTINPVTINPVTINPVIINPVIINPVKSPYHSVPTD